MTFLLRLAAMHSALARVLDNFQSLTLLATRFYVAWQFWKAGWIKITTWDTTLILFQNEYKVPVLSPQLAAVTGTFGELFFPALLFLGLFGRIGALGLFAVNAIAVISYAHVLLEEGLEAALAQHVLWGFMLIMLVVFGPGRIAFDAWLERRSAARTRPVLA
jgi:putative oxidoreductase